LKGARAADEGRIVPLTLATAKAIVVYLRARQSHGQAQNSPAVWLGTRNRGADLQVQRAIEAKRRRGEMYRNGP
jgi:hypothetical protein